MTDKAAVKRFCPPGNGGTEGGVKTIEAMTRARSQALPSGSSFDEVKAAVKRFCPPGNGGTEGGVKTIEAMSRFLEYCRA